MNLEQFIEILSGEFPEDRLTYQKGIPTFHPETAEEASRLFGLAGRHGQKLYITGFGNNITPVGRKFNNLLAVHSDRLNQLIRIVPQDYYAEVGSGYPLGELNHHLKSEGFFLPHAELPYVGSVGGALAAGLSADHGGQVLPIGRYFLMTQLAMPDGRVIRPGSPCFKSVSGLDIVKIFSPSWGLLGMIISAVFRIQPLTVYDDFREITMRPIEYKKFAGLYKKPGDNQSAIYSLKIKDKFDPNHIMPLIDPD